MHSSQTGETSKHLKKTISKGETAEEEDEELPDYEDLIREEIRNRGRQEHVSFFGFTGTPKNKTLELFGRRTADGRFVPFHSYTMRQVGIFVDSHPQTIKTELERNGSYISCVSSQREKKTS